MSVNLTIIFYVLIVVAMVAFILVQRSPGATAGSAFGAGASATVFGSKGSGNFLTKSTMILAFLFFAISMMMAVEAKKEFSAVNSGDVDLGVMGTLENESDVPEVKPLDSGESSSSDVPSLDTSAMDSSEDVPAVEGTDENSDTINTEADANATDSAEDGESDSSQAEEQ